MIPLRQFSSGGLNNGDAVVIDSEPDAGQYFHFIAGRLTGLGQRVSTGFDIVRPGLDTPGQI